MQVPDRSYQSLVTKPTMILKISGRFIYLIYQMDGAYKKKDMPGGQAY